MAIYLYKLSLDILKSYFSLQVVDIVPWRNIKYISIYSTFQYFSEEAVLSSQSLFLIF